MSNSPKVYAQKQANWETVQRLWKEGKTMGQICKELDWSISLLSVQMVRMRDEGWDLPYRYDRERRKKMRAGRR